MRILIADDDRITRKLLDSHLKKWGYDTVACSGGKEAWQVLQQEDAPRLAILDWIMPGMDGVEVCRRIRDVQGQKYIYIILLTSKKEKRDVVEGLDAGADDYVMKPFDPGELKVRVRAGARIIQLQEDLRSALKMSEFRASHDPLTGLWNRGAILDILNMELSRSKRQGIYTGIAVADIDFFKGINDQFGHLAGDEVLRQVSARMTAAVRPYDSIGRYGGEEFLVVIPGCDREEACEVAERMRREFNASPVRTSDGVFSVTLSFGVTAANPGLESTTDDLVRQADTALYRAKENGRNRVEWNGRPEPPLSNRIRREPAPYEHGFLAQ